MQLLKQGGRELADRFMVLLTLFYTAGIITVRQGVENPKEALLPAGILIVLSAFIIYFGRIGFYKLAVLVVAALCGGAAFFYAVQDPAGGLLDYAGMPAYIEGTVSEEPNFFEDHDAYIMQVETVETGQGRHAVRGTLLVKLYGENEIKYRYGDSLRLRATIVEPRGQRNPGSFDYRFYLKSRGIEAIAYPRTDRVEYLGHGKTGFLAEGAINLRGGMVEVINSSLPSPSGDLLAAILFGQGHRLPETVEHNFQRAGAGHLLAVSGLHVGLVAALIAGLWRRLGLRGRFPLLLAVVLVLGYAYLTGMRPSALRAAVMVSITLGALLLERERDLPTAVSLAALITLAVNPLFLFGPGFQLSYAATLTLIYAYRPLEHLLGSAGLPVFLRSPLAVVLAAQLGVLPLCVYYFHHLPTAAIIFNLLLMPLTAFMIGLGLAGALIGLLFQPVGEILLWAARPLLELILRIVEWSSLPGFYIALQPPGFLLLALFYGFLAAFLIFYYRWKKQKERGSQEPGFCRYAIKALAGINPAASFRGNAVYGIVLFAAVIMIWKGIIFPPSNDLKVTFIDVGQGASAMIEAPCGAVIMVDAGGELPFYGAPGETGERVLLPLLRRERIDKIDMAVITHPHEDHFGGFIPLIGVVEMDLILVSPVPGESVYYEELLLQAEAEGIPVEPAGAGETWSCGAGGLIMEMYGPPPKLFSGTGSDLNNNSIVFRLNYGQVRMLFTGDVEDPAVIDLFKRLIDLEAEVLQVPHHGGYMAQMPEFLEQVRPRLAVIQVGTNPFGHPHPFVIDSLEGAGVEVFRNDCHGAVIIQTDGTGLEVYTTEKPVPAAQ